MIKYNVNIKQTRNNELESEYIKQNNTDSILLKILNDDRHGYYISGSIKKIDFVSFITMHLHSTQFIHTTKLKSVVIMKN